MMKLDLDRDASGREATLEQLTRSDDRDLAALAHLRLSTVRRQQGRLDEAVVHAEAVRDDAAAHGPFHRLLDAHLRLGDLARLQGRLDDAARTLRAARGLASPASSHVLLANLDLALLRCEQGRFAAADRLWQTVLARLEQADRRLSRRRGAFLLCRAPCRAAAGDTDRFDAELEEGRALCAEQRLLEADVPRMLGLACELWLERGDEARARVALQAALEHAEAAGATDELARLQPLVAKL